MRELRRYAVAPIGTRAGATAVDALEELFEAEGQAEIPGENRASIRAHTSHAEPRNRDRRLGPMWRLVVRLAAARFARAAAQASVGRGPFFNLSLNGGWSCSSCPAQLPAKVSDLSHRRTRLPSQ